MKAIIEKAVNKAQAKGLGVADTVELIMDYLDIAGEITASPAPVDRFPELREDYGKSSTLLLDDTKQQMTAPVQVGKTIAKAGEESTWTSESLFKVLVNVDWQFDATPIGWDRPLHYTGTLVQEPRGMEGVAVIFKCIEVDNPREMPVFFALSEKVVDPAARIAEVRSQVEQLFRRRDTPVANSATAITHYPSMDEIMQGGGMYGGNVV